MECNGIPEYVLVGGRVCVDEGQLKVVQGHGKYVPTPTHSEFVYNIEKVYKFFHIYVLSILVTLISVPK